VDISPVSEFVLQKFIDQGAALDQLAVSDVVKLSGRVEEFDITLAAAANLDAVFAALESEIGDFVENEVAVSTAPAGNAASIAGNYRNAAFSFGLSDRKDFLVAICPMKRLRLHQLSHVVGFYCYGNLLLASANQTIEETQRYVEKNGLSGIFEEVSGPSSWRTTR